MSGNGPSTDSPAPFVIEDRSDGRTLVVTGKWSSQTAAALESGLADGLELNDARGYRERDLEFIDSWGIRRLIVLDRRVPDLSPLERLGGTLEELRLDSTLALTINLAAFRRLMTLAAEWAQIRETASAGGNIRDLMLFLYDGADLHELSTFSAS